MRRLDVVFMYNNDINFFFFNFSILHGILTLFIKYYLYY